MKGYTDGPWEVSLYNSADERLGLGEYNVNTSDGMTVAQCGVSKANAQLIATAPEMLIAIKKAHEMLTTHLNINGALYVLSNAINKAEGKE
jgi:hypothetical protein